CHTKVVKCQKCKLVTTVKTCQVPYVSCKMVPHEVVRCVPLTTCRWEPYCVTYKVCRRIPIYLPVCEPSCPLPLPGPPSSLLQSPDVTEADKSPAAPDLELISK